MSGKLLKRKPRPITCLLFIGLMAADVALGLVKWGYAFRININRIVINETIHSHISNFILSLFLYLVFAFIGLIRGISLKKMALAGLFLATANVVCETAMGFMNTPDMLDAVYGIAGTTIGLIFAWGANRYGMESV